MGVIFKYRAKLPGTYVQSERIYWSTASVIRATLSAKNITGTVTFFLSSDDGVTWEVVTNQQEHVFTTSSNKLRWRAIGLASAELLSPVEVNYVLAT